MTDDTHKLIRDADVTLRAGNITAAIVRFRHILSVDPALPDVWYNLGYALRLNRNFIEALDAYDKALAYGVTGPEEVHLNRAAIFSEHMDALDHAINELNAALLLNPRFLSGWLNLGVLHEDMGETKLACKAYERVLQIAPQNGRAMARLAVIATFQGKAADIAPRLEKALRLPTLPVEDAIDIGFGLANLYDAIGQHEQAFALVASANRAQYEQLPKNMRYDPAAHEHLVDSLCAMRVAPAAIPADTSSAVPIFICGLFRSGSTLAEQLLARHSEVLAGGEYDFIPEMVRHNLAPYPQALIDAGHYELKSLHFDYLSRLAATGYTGGPVSDKRCDNFLHIGLIKSLFPTAKIIHSYRFPLDNAVSLFFQHFADGINYSMNMAHLGHWLGQYRRLMIHWRALYGPDIHDFCYDAAVIDVECAVRAMVEHCGLQWRDDTGSTNGAVKTASAWQVRQPLHQRSSGRWRNYTHQLKPVRQVAGIDEHGNWLTS